jgi:hypothetical protein
MNIVVAGGRYFTDWGIFSSCMDRLQFPDGAVTVYTNHVEGTARMAERYADIHHWKHIAVPFVKQQYGSIASVPAVWELLHFAEGVIIFSNNEDEVVSYLAKVAKLGNIRLIVFDYDGNVTENFPDTENKSGTE